MKIENVVSVLLALAASPLLFGVINRTKAFFAGRKGQSVFQLYYDIFKLLRKNVVYSRTTTWIFKTSPIIVLSVMLTCLLLVPNGVNGSLISFSGDVFLLVYLLSLARFFIVIGALDTGSSFEGMGASREVWISTFAEPAMLLGFIAIAKETSSMSLAGMYLTLMPNLISHGGIIFILVALSLFIILLAENCRVPVDDPNTHLELTMIHEVMVLDNSGPDLAFILYSAALKMWIFASLLVGIILPINSGNPYLNVLVTICGIITLSIIVGIVESTIARLKLIKIPQLLAVATVLAATCLVFSFVR